VREIVGKCSKPRAGLKIFQQIHIFSRTEDVHQANGLQFTARVGELPEDIFSLVGFELTEGLSELVHGRLKMASNLPKLAAADILEQHLELTIWQNGAAIRRFTGVVSEFVRGDSGHRRTHYEVVIQPPLWRLGLMHYSRIFQSQSTDNILRSLIRGRDIADAVFDLRRQSAAHPPQQ
jgi:type VI secretion system secreted protein VgrG